MLGRALVVMGALVAAGLAGCISGPQDAPPAPAPANATDDGLLDANDSTQAPDGRGDLSAFKETNRTETGMGGMEHLHDYWKGQETIDLYWLPVSLIPFPLFPENKPAGTAIADFDIPAEYGLVYEGTSEVVLTMTQLDGPCARGNCAPDAGTTVFFSYLTAADGPEEFREGGELKLNEPFVIPIRPTEADMPHQTKSLWIFRIYSGQPTWFTANITVTIRKGYDVVDWPPHPDLYGNSPTRVLFDGPVHIASKGTIDANLYGTDANWQRPERIISYGTDRVEIEVTDVQIRGQGGLPPIPPQSYVLEYHNASKPPLLGNGAQYGARLQDEQTDGTTWRFVIDVSNDPMSYDTPYGTASRWGFRFVPAYEQQDGTVCVQDEFAQQILVGCQFYPFELDYHIKIVAHGHSTADGGIDAAEAEKTQP